MQDDTSNQYSVVMFAHNEEKNILRSVQSVFNNVDARLHRLFVVANGCTDSTIALLQSFKADNAADKLEILDLEIGDKCNAWNTYVHDVAPECCSVHFFVDADVSFTENAFSMMFDSILSQPEAMAIAGLPFSGRNIKFYRSLVIDRSCLFGNCYGLKFDFIRSLREKNQRLPVGLNWIDSAITKLVNTDIGKHHDNIPGRVTYDLNAGYYFSSLKPYVLSDIDLYFNRIARYKLGKLQEVYLDKMTFPQWPTELSRINAQVKQDIDEGRSKVPFYLKRLIYRRLNKSIQKQ